MNAPAAAAGDARGRRPARAFPLLITAYEMPFVALSRAVVQANQREEQEQLSRMVRMYDRVRRAAIEGHGAARLIDDLAARAGLRPARRRPRRRADCSRARRLPAALLVRAARAARAARAGPPAVLRLQRRGAGGARRPGARDAARRCCSWCRARREPPLALLQHVATIVALEVEKLTAEREHRRRIGSELLASILEGRVDGAVAADQLELHGLRRRRAGRRRARALRPDAQRHALAARRPRRRRTCSCAAATRC